MVTMTRVDFMFETHDKSLAWFRKLNKIKLAYEKDKAFRDSLYLVKPLPHGRFLVIKKLEIEPIIRY